MLLTAALEGKISLERVVDAVATNPAKIFGVQNKGDIVPGNHADIVLVDLENEYEIKDEDVLSLTGWTPYAGRRLRGKTILTLLRGKPVYKDGKVVGDKGYGEQAIARQST